MAKDKPFLTDIRTLRERARMQDFSPDGLSSRSHAEFVEGADLMDMIKQDLVAERIAIDRHRDMVAYLGSDDSTTRRLLAQFGRA